MSFTTEQLIEQYIKLRDTKDALTTELKKQLEPIEKAMDTISAYLLDQFNQSGETSKATPAGTAFVKVSDFVGMQDFDSFMAFVRENNAENFLKKDVNKTAVMEYVKEHGTPPPGVNMTSRREVQIRRPRS